MASSKRDSIIPLNPRAPIPRDIAIPQIIRNAGVVNRISTPEYPKSASYCFESAPRTSVRTRMRSVMFRGFNDVIVGRRPVNSGIKPYLIKSGSKNCLNIRNPQQKQTNQQAPLAHRGWALLFRSSSERRALFLVPTWRASKTERHPRVALRIRWTVREIWSISTIWRDIGIHIHLWRDVVEQPCPGQRMRR